jgi:hypothetical protein
MNRDIMSMKLLSLRRVIALGALLLVSANLPAWAVNGFASDELGDIQEQDIEAAPPIAGAGIAFDFQQTYLNIFGLPPRPPTENIIHWPLGTVWNGDLFPQCDPSDLLERGPAACPANSQFLSGEGVAAVGSQLVTITATITGFVGTPQNGDPTQVFYVVPQIGPAFVLIGVLRNEPEGPYGLAEHLSLNTIPGATGLSPSPIVVLSFHSVDQHTYVTRNVNGRTVAIPLTVAPPTCDGYWYYAIDNIYAVGAPLRSTSRQPCTAAP